MTSFQVRAIWYLTEVAVQEGSCGYVCIGWDHKSTIFDFHRSVFFRMILFYRTCWPVRPMPVHSCCSPSIYRRICKPIVNAVLTKEGRARWWIHDAPPEKIVEALSSYGITRDMLPTQMGGAVQLNLSEWLANRRAIEMEEL